MKNCDEVLNAKENILLPWSRIRLRNLKQNIDRQKKGNIKTLEPQMNK